jgi:hypothetical protein
MKRLANPTHAGSTRMTQSQKATAKSSVMPRMKPVHAIHRGRAPLRRTMVAVAIRKTAAALVEKAKCSVYASARADSGDLWLLGEHRLLCGDAGSETDLDRLLDGATVE